MDQGLVLGGILLIVAVIVTVGGVWYVNKQFPKDGDA